MTSPSQALLRIEGVGKRYGEGDAATVVLRGVDLTLPAGGTLAVLGPSGSGKSTLLNIAGTLEAPSEGRVLFDGRDVSTLDARELARHRHRNLGFVFQHHHLLPQLTALENVLLPSLAEPRAAREPGEDDRALDRRARSLLERVGLAARMRHLPAALSGGERQRVAVVRALLMKPRLILADEPTGSLDSAAADALGDLLCKQSSEEGAALLLVTHSERLASRMSGAVVLEGGRLSGAAARR